MGQSNIFKYSSVGDFRSAETPVSYYNGPGQIGELLIKKNLGRLIGEDFLFEDNVNYISESGWHHMGGTRMGNDEKNSVVDQNLKIHGSKNIYVIGSSVFPTGGHANPTFTIIQLTLRLKKHFSKNFII